MITVICSWCGKRQGEKHDGNPTARVSHGICDDCRRKYFGKHARGNSGSVETSGGVVMSTAGSTGFPPFTDSPPLPTVAEVEALR